MATLQLFRPETCPTVPKLLICEACGRTRVFRADTHEDLDEAIGCSGWSWVPSDDDPDEEEENWVCDRFPRCQR